MDAIFERYRQALKESKTRILNELCEVCGYHRKYTIAKINHWRARQETPAPPTDLRTDQARHPAATSDRGPVRALGRQGSRIPGVGSGLP
jgi:hypothetical protein